MPDTTATATPGPGPRTRGGPATRPPATRPRRLRRVRRPSPVTEATCHDTCVIVREFERELGDEQSGLGLDVVDEVTGDLGAVTAKEEMEVVEDSSPLTKLEYKSESYETATLPNSQNDTFKLIEAKERNNESQKSAKNSFKCNTRKVKRNQPRNKSNKKDNAVNDSLRTEIIKYSAEEGFSQCSERYGISVETIKKYIQNWIGPESLEDSKLPADKCQIKTCQDKNIKPEKDKISIIVKKSRGRPKNSVRKPSDLSEMPLSHVKLMRKELTRSTKIQKKKDKFKSISVDKKVNGSLNLKRQKISSQSKIRSAKKHKLILAGVKSAPVINAAPPLATASLHPDSNPVSSVTVFDADVARPGRSIQRPVRYLDSLNQNSENIAIKKLNIVDKFDFPYNKESLVWNKLHCKNKQNTYCYCGGPGTWHCKMVQCVRCSQWFHERCLAPRPYNMPIIPGDCFWLFVCSLCNSGSECLKRMDLSWADLVHLALYDLTAKTQRKLHDYDGDIMPHLVANWSMFQLRKHHNILAEDERRTKTKECLIMEKERFECGSESRQDANLWGLRRLTPPPRPVYKVPDLGIISERTVLNEFSVAATVTHERTETFVDGQIVKIYSPFVEGSTKNSGGNESKVVKCESETKVHGVIIENKVVNDEKGQKVRNQKTKRVSNNSVSSHVISTKSGLNKLLNAKVNFKALKLPKEILNVTCKSLKQDKKLPKKKCGPKTSPQPKPSPPPPPPPPKPLPFEIARILHKKGYPKVAMKFASIIPPKREHTTEKVSVEIETSPESKSKKKKSNKKESESERGNILNDSNSSLLSLIPEKPNFLGENNPFQLGSVEEQRAARNFLCNRKLKEEDLTRWRSKLKKRKYRLNFEQARKMWRKENTGNLVKPPRKASSKLVESKKQMQYAGKFTAPSGEKKIILLRTESPQFACGEVEM